MLQNDAEAFYKSLTDRLESSNFRMSIGSMNAYVEESCNLFEPLYANIDDFRSQIDAAQGSKAKTISPNF